MTETNNIAILETTLRALAESKKYVTLRDILTTIHAADIAAIFERLQEEDLPLLFRLLPKELAAETFVEMQQDTQEALIRTFSDRELKQIVGELYVDDAVDIIEEMPANVVRRILEMADPEMRRSINELLRFPEDSAGSIMTTEYVALRPSVTVQQAIGYIRKVGPDKETINSCYVLSPDRKLIGVVSIRRLLLSDDEATSEQIMDENINSVSTLTDQEEVALQFSRYNYTALPVVDQEHRMVGIVTFDDAMDVMEEEATEDMQIMAAMTPTDKTYLHSDVLHLFLQRVPWLLILMVSATFTGMIITGFESALAAQAALVAFIPMLMGTGGNSGSQSSVTVIRGLSLGELDFRDVGAILWKEIRISLLCGLALGVVGFVKILLVDKLLLGNSDITIGVTLTVSITLLLTVVAAKIIGGILPLAAKKVGLDPAVMASPFITTIVDALSLLVYFGVATCVLRL